MARAAGLICLLLLGGRFAAAQETLAPVSPATQTISFDVLVDGASRPLTANDFSATQGDVALTISAVRLVAPAANTTALPSIASDDDERQAAAAADRLVAIYVDEYHLSPGASLDSAKAALASFVRTSLGPRDLVAVVKPLASLSSIRLSADREAAARAIEESAARQGDLTPRSSFEQQYFAADPDRIEAARSQIVLSSLSAVTTHLGRFSNGRKTLVVLSNGLSAPPRSRVESVLPGEETIARSANQARVGVYLIRPDPSVRGVETRGNDAARRQEPPTGPVRGARESGLRDAGGRQPESRDAGPRREPLAALAERTTGLVTDSASAANGLRQMLGDASRYYLLDVVAPQPPDDQYRTVAIRSRLPGVRLRARDGYAVMRSRPADSDADTPARAMARIPRQTSRLIRVWFGQTATVDGQTHLVFVWEPAPRMPGARIATPGLSRVSLTVTASNGDTIFSGETIASGRALVAGSAAADRSQATFTAAPGTLLAQIEVLDTAGRVLDKDVRDIIVRGVAAPGSFGTAAVYRSRSAADLRALREDVTAAPVASRQFSRAESLVIRTATSGDAAASTVSARLISGFGSTLRALDVHSFAVSGQTMRQVELPLAALASGQYAVEFTAGSPAGTSVERVSFTVTP